MKTLFLLLAMLTASVSNLLGQELYRTKHGDMAIGVTIGDSVLLMISNELILALDYETSKVTFRVPIETFTTRVDSIDAHLKAMKGVMIEFSGKLGISINMQNYAPQKYILEGQLTSAHPSVPIKGSGSMNCLPAGDRISPACTFLVTLQSTLTALQLHEIFPYAQEGVRIEIRQSILEKDNE